MYTKILVLLGFSFANMHLRGQKPYSDVYTDKVVYIISCVFVNIHFYCTGISLTICISKLTGKKAYHDELTDIMVDVYSYIFL